MPVFGMDSEAGWPESCQYPSLKILSRVLNYKRS